MGQGRAAGAPGIERIFHRLSHPDALRIFRLAKDGLKSKSETPQQLGLTPKRYYTRLRSLVAVGLLRKRAGAYSLTDIGQVVYHALFDRVERALRQREELAIVERLREGVGMATEEVQHLVAASEGRFAPPELGQESGTVRLVQVLEGFDDFVAASREIVEHSSSEVRLATRFSDIRLFEPLLQAFGPSENLPRVLVLDGDIGNQELRAHVLRTLIASPRLVRTGSSANRPVQLKYSDLPYSFIVSDGRTILLEIVNAATREFSTGLLIESESLAGKFLASFDRIWAEAGADVLREFSARVRDWQRS